MSPSIRGADQCEALGHHLQLWIVGFAWTSIYLPGAPQHMRAVRTCLLRMMWKAGANLSWYESLDWVPRAQNERYCLLTSMESIARQHWHQEKNSLSPPDSTTVEWYLLFSCLSVKPRPTSATSAIHMRLKYCLRTPFKQPRCPVHPLSALNQNRAASSFSSWAYARMSSKISRSYLVSTSTGVSASSEPLPSRWLERRTKSVLGMLQNALSFTMSQTSQMERVSWVKARPQKKLLGSTKGCYQVPTQAVKMSQ